MPSISIVMPTYNYASHIIEQINNVLKQQHTDFELIICDDGSTDDTVDKVAAITDVRVKYHQLSHNNANVARN
jgi:glycosyltransferase involved in cell wall biosynthesis